VPVYCSEALEEATVIAGLVSAAAVVGSLLFLARQTSHSVHQSLVANELAGARAMAQGYEIWDRVIAYFVKYPELREYFYEGVELPEDSTTRARVLAVAELMADALQTSYWLFQGKDVESLGSVDDPALDIRSDWDDWTEFILTMSPALRSLCERTRSSTRLSSARSTRSSLPRPPETVITVSTRWRRQTSL
jgi:hypothetical protein